MAGRADFGGRLNDRRPGGDATRFGETATERLVQPNADRGGGARGFIVSALLSMCGRWPSMTRLGSRGAQSAYGKLYG